MKNGTPAEDHLCSLDPGGRHPLSVLVQPPHRPHQALKAASEIIIDQLEVKPVAVEKFDPVASRYHLSELVIGK